jgi:hypothetical protein
MGAKPTFATVLGIAKETVFGTPVAATAFIAPTGPPTPKDVTKFAQDKGMRGSMTDYYDEVPTVKSSTFDFAGDVFPDTIGWPLVGVLGEIATTGASAPYTHSCSLLNSGDGQCPSYTITDYYAVNTRQYPGAKFSEVGFKFNADGMLTFTAKAVALASVPTTNPTPSFTTASPMPGWTGTVQIGGTAVHTVLDGDLTIKRPVTIVTTVDNSQNPHALWSGPLSVSGKMTLIMEDESQLTNYLTATDPSLDITFSSGTGPTLVSLKLHMSSVVYQSADIGRGKDYVELAVAFTAKANTTDIGASGGYAPIKATLQNAINTGTYK